MTEPNAQFAAIARTVVNTLKGQPAIRKAREVAALTLPENTDPVQVECHRTVSELVAAMDTLEKLCDELAACTDEAMLDNLQLRVEAELEPINKNVARLPQLNGLMRQMVKAYGTRQ